VDQSFEAMVVWMGEDPLLPGKQYFLKQSSRMVGAQVSNLRYKVDVNTLHREAAPALAMNEVGRCTVTTSRPACFDPYAHNRATGSFIVIDRSTNRTVGAGMIVDRATSLKFLRDYWDTDVENASPRGDAASPGRAVSLGERVGRFGHQPATVLLTGPSGSGKTTIAYALERRLFDAGRNVCVLDGREMRRMISRDLGYSKADRSENLRRAIEVARVVNGAGVICICAFIAPSRAVREKARTAVGAGFFEIHLSASDEIRRARDQGGYNRPDDMDAAEYEPPEAADLVLETDRLSVDECSMRILELLQGRGIFG
jgi:bifunctional enzyme CysN/CysC